MDPLPPLLLQVPPGCLWRRLGAEDGPRLAPVWRDLFPGLCATPFWRTWFPILMNRQDGWFDAHFMQVLGLFDSDGEMICCAAEVEHFDRADVSQIMFWVPLSWRSRGLGSHALRAAFGLVRQRGRAIAQAECPVDNGAAVALLRRHDMRELPGDGAWPGCGRWARKLEAGILGRILPQARQE